MPSPAAHRSASRRALLLTTSVAVATAAMMASPSATPAARAGTQCPAPAAGVVRAAPGAGRTVALTFDDGPSAFTRQVLVILRRKNVRATFFNTGAHAALRPGVEAQVAAEGHLLGNHTWDHRYPTQVAGGWSRSYLSSQLSRTNRVEGRTGGHATCFFRPPGGFLTPTVLPAARAHHLSVVMWSVDTEDWRQPASTSPAFVEQIVGHAAAGLAQSHPIVLMHDGKASHEPEALVHRNRSNGVAALPAIIDMYRRHGYRFVDLRGRTGLPPAPTVLGVDRGRARVPAGVRTLAVTGRLSAITGPLGDEPVHWYSRTPGNRRWHLRGTVTTGARGYARVFVRPTRPLEYTLRFGGASGYRPVRGDAVHTLDPFTYASEVAASADRDMVDAGGAVRLAAWVTSQGEPRQGAEVTLTRTLTSGEVDVWRLRTDASGKVAVSDVPMTTAIYRFTVAQALPYAAGASDPVQVGVAPAPGT